MSIRLPEFIVLGAAKAGTTSIYHYLKQHPGIFLPALKELKFFTGGSDKDFAGYLNHFAPNTEGKLPGEVSSDYLYSGPGTAEIISKYLPDVKLVAILRDPVDRGFSEYCMDVKNGKVLTDYRTALEGKYKFRYRNQGLYFKQLSNYLAHFDRSRIKIYFFEDLCADHAALMKDLFRFIGVSDDVECAGKSNIGYYPRSRRAQKILQRPNPLRSAARSILGLFMDVEQRQKLRAKFLEANKREKPGLDPALRKELISFYKDDILKLQELTGRDLSAWMQ